MANMGHLQRAWLLFHTIRYLSPGQVRHRLWRMARTHWRKLSHMRAPQPSGCRFQHYQSIYTGLSDIGNTGLWQAQVLQSLERAKKVSRQHFSFLQHSHVFDKQVLWEDPNLSQLWRYHLHYFDYVNDFLVWSAVGHAMEAYQTFRRLADSWIQGNHRLTGDGWHPYTVSLRIVNWLNAYGHWRSTFDREPAFRKRFLSSLYGQTRFLAANLEHDVRGNHLLKNLKGLVWAGVAFEGEEAQGWYAKALRILQKELAEQVLHDGGHFERAPGYHGAVLKDCLEMALWMKRNGCPVPACLDDSVLRMLSYLKTILPLDGQVPLLKDTAWDTGPAPLDLLSSGALYLNRAEFKITDTFGWYPWLLFGHGGRKEFQNLGLSNEPKVSKPLVDSGFIVLRDDQQKDYLIFDAGKPCPDYLPAHAHADMFSYELMIDGRRVVVDSGVYEYEQGKWRDFFRSTRAHNTVELEDMNQSEVWGSFRVARRGRPGPVKFEKCDTHVIIDAQHDGYQRLGLQAVHRRILIWEKGEFWLVFDEIIGKGRLRAKSYVHLHPSLELVPRGGAGFSIENLDSPLRVQGFSAQHVDTAAGRLSPPIQGWYSERFGVKEPNVVLCFSKRGALSFCLGYFISRHEDSRIRCRQWGSRSYTVTVQIADKSYEFMIGPEKVTCSSRPL